MQNLRIGMGHDIHGLVYGRELWLGGVNIPFDRGLNGHSDADALIHAIMDAMLGALALGDIGQLFPDTDPAYRGISSLKLLAMVVEKVAETGYKVGNLDCMIHCEAPKIAPYRAAIIETLAKALKVEQNQVSLKAGTNESFDAVGEGLAIACQAIVLMVRE
mgnify:CR=1 FL=1